MVGGKTYEHGLGTHAPGEAVFDIPTVMRRFVAEVGMDDEVEDDEWQRGSVCFEVYGTGETDDTPVLLGQSPVLSPKSIRSWAMDVELETRFKKIALVVSDGGDGNECDHADWVNAGFVIGRVLGATDAYACNPKCADKQMKDVKRILRLGMAALVPMAALTVGFQLRGWHDQILRRSQMEDGALELSFSEVENAKAVLRSLFCEFTNALIDQQVMSEFRSRHPDPVCLDRVLRELRNGVSTFKGTEQELWLTRDLLWVLKLRQDHQAWLDLYLDLLYRLPSGMSGSALRTPPRCPKCGARLHSGKAEGLCPRCLVAMNLTIATEPPPNDDAPTDHDASPSAAEIARLFPHLKVLECLGRGGMGSFTELASASWTGLWR